MNAKLESRFLRDGSGMIETVDYSVNQLEERGFDNALIEQAFRAVHSLKSESAFLGYSDLADNAGLLEELLDRWKKRKAAPPDADAKRILAILQTIKGLFRSIATHSVESGDDNPSGKSGNSSAARPVAPKTSGDSPGRRVPAGRAAAHTQKSSAIPREKAPRAEMDPEFAIHLNPFQRQLLREARGRMEQLYRLECEVDPSEPMTYARLYLVISNLEQIVHVVKMYPSLDAIRQGKSAFLQVLLTTTLPEEKITNAVNVDQISHVQVSPLEYEPILRNSADESVSDRAGAPGERLFSVSMPGRKYEELCLNADEIYSRLGQEWTELEKAPIESSIKARIQWNLLLVNRLAAWMRSTISSFSTAPLTEVFQGLSSFVEELGRQLGKQVVLRVQGEHARVYLPVSDTITDVLLHLLRNAIDHGIETPEVRRQRQKPAQGTIRISVTSGPEKLTIRVEDDGNGIPEDLIAEMQRGSTQDSIASIDAESSGLRDMHPDQKAVREQRDLLSIISRAGFTTRSEPTEVSGRGVGLDVVSYSVRKLLCGRIELQNRPGKGCVFSLVLPASTNLITVLILQARGEYLALPRVFISDTFELDRRFVFNDEKDSTYYRYGGENVRLYTVYEHFPEALSFDRKRMGVIIEIAGERGVIVSDRFVSEETVVHDRSRRNVVFSQILNKDVRLFLPSQLLSALSFRRGESH